MTKFCLRIVGLLIITYALAGCITTSPGIMYDGQLLPESDISVIIAESSETTRASQGEEVIILAIDERNNDPYRSVLHVMPGVHTLEIRFFVEPVGLISLMVKNTDSVNTNRDLKLETEAGKTYVVRFLPDPLKYWIEEIGSGAIVVGERPRWMKPYE